MQTSRAHFTLIVYAIFRGANRVNYGQLEKRELKGSWRNLGTNHYFFEGGGGGRAIFWGMKCSRIFRL